MAARLSQTGMEDFLILEKATDVGGTWRDNPLSRLRVRRASRLYSLSFAPKVDWSRDYAPAGRSGTTCGNASIGSGCGHGSCSVQTSSTRPGPTAAGRSSPQTGASGRLMPSSWASGGLHVPSDLTCRASGSFAGEVLHTADWPPDGHLDGRRVAVVGTGASAVQLIPAIASRVSDLVVFQRTPSWILQRNDRIWSHARAQTYSRMPFIERVQQWRTYLRLESRVLGFGRLDRPGDSLSRKPWKRPERQVPDPATREALTPRYALGCKRVLSRTTTGRPLPARTCTWSPHRSSGWSPRAWSPRTVSTTTSTRSSSRPVSTCGAASTGCTSPGRAVEPCPASGKPTAAPTWASKWPGSELYLLLGPNTALGHNSVLIMIEAAVEHPARAASSRPPGPRRHPGRSGEVRALGPAADPAYRLGSGCQSWYLDERGRNVAIWPASTVRYSS
ncbi:MAG: NAD(P)/FAD-dependent oxidoreductase [Actinomycetales bacterium]|nr:NAD(P)/FAD-dependent oxidoreductase [Candidatus Phosphoribacter baldrii]